jgi:hypothetical protein
MYITLIWVSKFLLPLDRTHPTHLRRTHPCYTIYTSLTIAKTNPILSDADPYTSTPQPTKLRRRTCIRALLYEYIFSNLSHCVGWQFSASLGRSRPLESPQEALKLKHAWRTASLFYEIHAAFLNGTISDEINILKVRIEMHILSSNSNTPGGPRHYSMRFMPLFLMVPSRTKLIF